MKSIKVSLVGCGRISTRHAQVITDLTDFTLASVCDTDSSLSTRYPAPFYTSMHEMVNRTHPDLISVLTPSGLHATHVTDLAVHETPIIVEKPIALTLPDADRMITTCQRYGVPLFVVKQNRFNVPIIQLRKAIEANLFGRIVSASIRVHWCRRDPYYRDWHGTWALSGGVLANQASHHIDLLQWMAGDPVSVFAYADTMLVDTEVEDILVAVVRFANGAVGTVEVTTCARPRDTEGSITILGEHGLVEVGGFACNKLVTWQFDSDEQLDITNFSENPPDVYGFGHRAYYRHVQDCLVNHATPLVTGTEARKSLAMTIALYQSVEEHREVFLDRPLGSSRLGQ